MPSTTSRLKNRAGDRAGLVRKHAEACISRQRAELRSSLRLDDHGEVGEIDMGSDRVQVRTLSLKDKAREADDASKRDRTSQKTGGGVEAPLRAHSHEVLGRTKRAAGATGSLRAILVHNPEAGDGALSGEELRTLLRNAKISALYQSSKVGELTAALSEPCDLVIVAGGDGTVAKAITQMPNRSVPVAILPLGTANNIAASFDIGGRLEEILESIRDAEFRRLDIGMVRGPWGCARVVEGIGLGALVRSAKRLGKPDVEQAARLKAALKAIRQEVKRSDADRVRVIVDDELMPEDHLLLEVLNIPCGGPRLRLAPQADPGDGLFDVVALEPSRRKEMLRWLKSGDAEEPPPFTTRRGRKIKLAWDGTPLHVDDDIPPPEACAATVELEVEQDAVSILVAPASGRPGEVRPPPK
jgi:diacylglycerol kinase (ATP)